ncbi:MAG: acetyltransferase, ribosomal protein N-acetylase [Chitinophagaceae bacterium]|nr:acetyltransferase, ribosomal protein N-acetylase [Chitinophagaceae bacterium]
MNSFKIDTQRLTLEPLDQTIIAEILERNDREEISTMFGIGDDESFETNRRKFVAKVVTPDFSILIFRILLKNTSVMIGWCGFHTWFVLHERAELGYMLLEEEYKQQGYMSEALPVVIQYGFEEMQLNRIEALIGQNNFSSLKLVAKNGFVQEGILRQHYKSGDLIDDSIMFSLLKEDYQHNKK